MSGTNDPDATIATLYEVLFRRLEHQLRNMAPSAVKWADRLQSGAVVYLQRYPRVWPRVLGGFEAPETEILTSLYDVEVGLDSVRFYSDQALTAPDLRALYMAMAVLPVTIVALAERLTHLTKRAHREGMISYLTQTKILADIEEYRSTDQFLDERDATAHGSYVSEESRLRVPERLRLWELGALSGVEPRGSSPLKWMYEGEVPPELHDRTRARVEAVESLTGRAVALIVDDLDS